MSTIRIVYIVIDTQRLTLYQENGEKLSIPQGDPRVPLIIEKAMPLVQAGKVAEVDLTVPNSYQEFEQKSSGLVRFFKVAKQKLSNLFSAPAEDTIAPEGTFGVVPPSMAERVAEIMQHAQPADGVNDDETHTTIAVVGGDTVIPHVDKIHGQISHAAKLGSTKGMDAFFARIAKVIQHRSHSVDDLLHFLQKADLPIANDGAIIAYKRLYRQGDNAYADPHTRKVVQRIGSYVCMDEKLVDPSRRQECSQGLHIGRRDYMGGFSGDAIVLVKIQPEDVIAVPHNEPSKIRVMGYHILGELTSLGFTEACNKRPLSNTKDLALLTSAVSGNHVQILETVRVTQAAGEGVVVTPGVTKPTTTKTNPAPVPHAMALDDPRAPQTKASAPVDPRKLVAQKPSNQKEEAPVPVTITRQEKARLICNRLLNLDATRNERIAAAHELKTLKKTSKLSYDKLGVGATALKMLAEIEKEIPAPVKLSPKTKAMSAALKGAEPAATPTTKVEPAPIAKADSARDARVIRLYNEGMTKRGIARKLGLAESTVRGIIKRG